MQATSKPIETTDIWLPGQLTQDSSAILGHPNKLSSWLFYDAGILKDCPTLFWQSSAVVFQTLEGGRVELSLTPPSILKKCESEVMCKITYRILYHTIQRLKPSQMPIGRVLTILWFILSVNVIDSEVNKKTPLGSSVRDSQEELVEGRTLFYSTQHLTVAAQMQSLKQQSSGSSLPVFPSSWWVSLSILATTAAILHSYHKEASSIFQCGLGTTSGLQHQTGTTEAQTS